jgi:tetratricopeptide (TPR) repeat protein
VRTSILKQTPVFVLAAFLLAAAPAGGATDGSLADARHLLRTGKYAEAAEAYGRRAADDAAAAIGLARVFRAQGRLDDARRALVPWLGRSAEADTESARLAFERGDWASAESLVDSALKLAPEHAAALWLRVELHDAAGRSDEAVQVCRRLVALHNTAKIGEAEPLRWIARAAARCAAANRDHEQFRLLVTGLYPEILARERDFWPAHYDAGRLLLAKHNRGDAAKHLKAALEINPYAAEVHVALAELALLDRDVDAAERAIRRALELRPDDPAAFQARADVAWLDSRFDAARQMLEDKVLPANPASEPAIGRLLAAEIIASGDLWRRGGSPAERLLQEAHRCNPRPNEVYLAAARWLELHHRMNEAEELLERALSASPGVADVTAELAQIKMQLGLEGEARQLFRAAFDRDPFNVRSKNILELLAMLDDLAREEAAGCVLRFDRPRDGLLARYAAEFLEKDYPRLCELFGFRPAERPLVEIFNEARGVAGAQWFGARMTGLPYVGPVAASTGKIVAMVSPNDPSLKGPYNWAKTLRHEMVHVITLQQTEYRIPHWYTEGLAVWSEGHPRPESWSRLLVDRERQDKLLSLSTIDLGFTRPDSHADRTLAYCQAELYVEYMLQGRPQQVLRDLLEAYREGLSTGEAIERVFGVPIGEFEAGYRRRLAELARSMADLLPEEERTFAELLAGARADPSDADAASSLAYAYLRRKMSSEAFESARTALKLRPRDSRATYVLARLHLNAGRYEAAIALLEDCLDEDSPDAKVLNLLAGLHLKAKNYDRAESLYRLGMKHNPSNPAWLRLLLRVYDWQGDEEAAGRVLGQVALADPHDMATRKRLVELCLKRGDYEAAIQWASEALEVDVNDAELHKAFAEALLARHNRETALRELEAAVQLEPANLDYQLALAELYLALGRAADARAILNPVAEAATGVPKVSELLELLRLLEANQKP